MHFYWRNKSKYLFGGLNLGVLLECEIGRVFQREWFLNAILCLEQFKQKRPIFSIYQRLNAWLFFFLSHLSCYWHNGNVKVKRRGFLPPKTCCKAYQPITLFQQYRNDWTVKVRSHNFPVPLLSRSVNLSRIFLVSIFFI